MPLYLSLSDLCSCQRNMHVIPAKGLGERFKKNLLAEIASIKQNPFTTSFRYDEERFAIVKRFHYAAHYTIDESNHLIKIHAILGFAHDSETNWKMRF